MLPQDKHQKFRFRAGFLVRFIKFFFFRIYVESQFPPTAVNAAIEECLAEMDHYLR